MALVTPVFAGVTSDIVAVGPNVTPELSRLYKFDQVCHAAKRKSQGLTVTMTSVQRQLAINAKAAISSWMARSSTPDVHSEDWIGLSRNTWLFGYSLDLQVCLEQLLPTQSQAKVAILDVETPTADAAPLKNEE
jgi:hypothetical protein